MSEMSKVEEVAQAMFKELSRQHPELSKGDGFGYAEAGYASADEGLTVLDGAYDLKAAARAVIEALRKPTEAMVEAGFHEIKPDGLPADKGDAAACFAVMIDAALKE